jgi:hypothetical protein
MTKLIGDCWLLFVSTLRVTLRNPAWVFIGLFQPICAPYGASLYR